MAHGRSSGSLRRHKHDHKVHVSQFRNRLETIKRHHPVHRLGSDTKSSDDYFVPEPLIQNTLLRKDYIQGLLKDVTELRQPPPRTIDTIFKQCPIIFCILLEIGEGEWIERIVEDDESWDRSLPFSAKPTYLPERVWEEFSAVQRRFKPKKLGASVLSFDSESIVPYTSVVRMDVGGSAQIWRVTLHGAYDDFRSQREAVLKSAQPVEAQQSDKEYAVKQYTGRHAETYFTAETKIFETIKGNKHKPYPTGLIEYFGAFKHNGGEAYFVVLELATGGSLRTMFRTKPPPTNGQEILQFWELLFELFQGLTSLHELQNEQDSDRRFSQCVHHDIHPANIVLIPGNYDQSKHYCLRYRYVLADLGHASTVSVPDASIDVQVPDPKAGREYAAPEVCATSEFESRLAHPVTAAVDIFSLGAVLLEAAVWIVRGPEGIKDFAEKRLQESKATGADSAHFHNSDTRDPQLLGVVQDHLEGKSLRRHIQKSDTTTLRVLENVVERMLSPEARDRPRARISLKDSERLLRNSRSTPGVDTSSTNDNSPHVNNYPRPRAHSSHQADDIDHNTRQSLDNTTAHRHSVQIPNTPPLTPKASIQTPPAGFASPRTERSDSQPPDPYINKKFVTVHEVLTYKNDRAGHLRQFTSSAKLRGIHEKNRMEDRDSIFLIDDSHEMGENHKISVLNTFEAMLYIVGDEDPDGVELYFTSDMVKHQHRHSKRLLELVKSHTYRNQTDMQDSLSKILAQCKDKLQTPNKRWSMPFRHQSRGTSIFVLTNGIWNSGDDVKPTILKCVDFLQEHGWGRDQLCVSFITFGDDQQGLARIAELDDLKVNGEAPLDVVDRESHEGSFWKILLGALDPAKDRECTYQEQTKDC